MKKLNKEYMNNTKVAKVISRSTGLIDAGAFDVGVIPKKGIITTVDLKQDNHIQLSSTNVTAYDMAIMDSFYTLLQSGHISFSKQMIARVMSGNMDQDVTPQKIGSITRSINKMRHIDVNIDCTDELRARGVIKENETAKYKSYLLPVSEIEIKSGNQKNVEGYKLLEKPALYVYAEAVGQILDVPITLLETQEEISDNDEVIVIKRYLIQCIESMKNTKNNINSNRIMYEWQDKNTNTEKGMYVALGYKAENFSNWKEKRRKINLIVKAILTSLKKQKYIQQFKEYKEGKKIAGFEIFFK